MSGALKPWHVLLAMCMCVSVTAIVAAVLVIVLRKKK
jgi:hypothetical protein